ncbi:hypothetical protein SAMN04487819_109230 [Actinopolyspora alba]|uniref:Uncharacterized protein n=2 Tax=Actinopolyspora alba TaxID=673379 RepID=A0A1I1YTP6_9ACTN|nr:hypothetical protein SAMN04487819_109230 [Actinopolyspora alba]
MGDQLRDELLRRSARDQQVRHQWLEQQTVDSITVREVDADNTARLAEIIDEHGWPGHTLVGTDGAHAAWLLAQHATPDYQQAWIDLLREAVDRQEATERDLAYLDDRVLLHQNLPQRYGTQRFGIGNQTSRLWPLADRERVNLWRSEIGLSPLDNCDLDQAWRFDELRHIRDNTPENTVEAPRQPSSRFRD